MEGYIVWECHKHLQFLSTLVNQVGTSCRLCIIHHSVPYNNIANSLFSLSSNISALLKSFVPVLSCVCVYSTVCLFQSRPPNINVYHTSALDHISVTWANICIYTQYVICNNLIVL